MNTIYTLPPVNACEQHYLNVDWQTSDVTRSKRWDYFRKSTANLPVANDCNLTYNRLISTAASKASGREAIILRQLLFYKCNVAVQSVHYVHYWPLLEYASHVWYVWSPSRSRLLPWSRRETRISTHTEKKITSRIPALENLSYPERLAMLNLDSLELRGVSDRTLYSAARSLTISSPSNRPQLFNITEPPHYLHGSSNTPHIL